ncbi:MAG: Rieske (2Fe-2S) protein, partial [Gammaproteobacteria bacterium]|nr:Rieske (2Fe-2S) protein [Gammaproteobacteria bacterium]
MAESISNKPGAARCPGISVQDLLACDSRSVPDYLTTQNYEFLGDEDIPFSRYTDRAFFDEEIARVWSRTWQWACREEHIPEAGDYYVYDVGPYSVIVMRTDSGEIKAYRNACMHRGTKLKPSFTTGFCTSLRCPYHGWEYALDGTLKSLPCEWDFPHVNPAAMSLSDVRAEIWGGFVFVNLDPDAVPLLEYLVPLPEHIDSRVFEQRYVAQH